jgi:hypothetical protein
LEQDIRFNPSRQIPDWNQDLAIALACPQAPKGSRECLLLLRSGELGDQQSVADADLVFQECLGHGRYEVGEPNTTVDIRLAFSSAGRDGGDGVGRLSEFQKRFETQSFLKRVYVFALQILDLSLVLKEHSTTYTTLESCTMQNRYL